jgi:hypothetical protein
MQKYLRSYLVTNGKYGKTGTKIFSKTQQIHQKLYLTKLRGILNQNPNTGKKSRHTTIVYAV